MTGGAPVRIGLIRHFPVQFAFPRGWRTSAELQDWLARYNEAPTSVGPFDLGGIAWRACLSSDLPRARTTAGVVFPGPVEPTGLLREVGFAAFDTGGLRLPVPVWQWLVRLCWLLGHPSQRTCRDEFKHRVQIMADRLSRATEDTLVVSHAGMMNYLSAALRARGFDGPRLGMPRHAITHVYEKRG